MKWIKASERLPEDTANARYNGKPGILKRTIGGCMFQGFNEGWGYSNNEPGLFHVEWLDESAPSPVEGKSAEDLLKKHLLIHMPNATEESFEVAKQKTPDFFKAIVSAIEESYSNGRAPKQEGYSKDDLLAAFCAAEEYVDFYHWFDTIFQPSAQPKEGEQKHGRKFEGFIPDHGEVCWSIGAENYTRKEVDALLHTQRAMISNDLKTECGDELTENIFNQLKHPRTPVY